MASEAPYADEYTLLKQQVLEFRRRLEHEGIVLDIDPALPVSEQFIRLQEAALGEVSRCKQHSATTRQVEERFRILVEASPNAITQTNLEGRILACNTQTLHMHGYTHADELIGKPAFELIAPEDRELAAHNMLRALAEGGAQNLQYNFLRKDGTCFPGELSVAVISDADGQPTAFVAISRDMSEHKQAGEALRDSEERYRQLYQALTDALFVLEVAPDGASCHFIEVNEVAVQRLGYTREELLQMSPYDIGVPDFPIDTSPAVAKSLAGEDVIFEHAHLTKDGRQIPVEVHAHSFIWQGRRAVMTLVRDITARKQAEAALQESEEQYHQLFQALTDALYVVEVSQNGILSHFVEVNKVAAQRLGYTREELLCLSPYDIDAPDCGIDIQPIIAKVLTGEDVIFEQIHLTKDGRQIPVEIHAHAFTWRGRRAIMSLVRDISARKQTEEALARERAFLDTAIEILPLPLFFMDRERHLLKANAIMRTLMDEAGVTELSEIQPLDLLTHLPIPPDRRPTARALHGEVITAEEYLLTVPTSGQQMPCLEFAAPIYLDGEIAAIVFVLQDISVLKEADKAKDEFLATLSHELQTPLTAMLGWSDFALVDCEPEFLRQSMEVIYRNARRQQVLIADMLDMSRLLHRKLALALAPTDLHRQVQQAVENVQHQAEMRKLTLTWQSAEEHLLISADPLRLQQCLANLLENSLKFTPAGGCITVTLRKNGEMACLEIQDNGRGISPETLPFIFNPFRQADRDESAGGLGLGLAVTRGIIDLHGGQIHAESAGIGKGSTFIITLPLLKNGGTGMYRPLRKSAMILTADPPTD